MLCLRRRRGRERGRGRLPPRAPGAFLAPRPSAASADVSGNGGSKARALFPWTVLRLFFGGFSLFFTFSTTTCTSSSSPSTLPLLHLHLLLHFYLQLQLHFHPHTYTSCTEDEVRNASSPEQVNSFVQRVNCSAETITVSDLRARNNAMTSGGQESTRKPVKKIRALLPAHVRENLSA